MKILILEDNPIVAASIKSDLKKLSYHPIDPVTSVTDAKMITLKDKPELALLDINLGEGKENGISFAEWLKVNFPIPIIFLTAFADPSTIKAVKNIQPSQYLVKPFNKYQLHVAIEIAFNNHYHPDTEYINKMKLERFNNSLSHPLSIREQGVLDMLLSGFSNQQIAEKLWISEHTVKTHLKNIFFKTEVQSRLELIAKIYIR